MYVSQYTHRGIADAALGLRAQHPNVWAGVK